MTTYAHDFTDPQDPKNELLFREFSGHSIAADHAEALAMNEIIDCMIDDRHDITGMDLTPFQEATRIDHIGHQFGYHPYKLWMKKTAMKLWADGYTPLPDESLELDPGYIAAVIGCRQQYSYFYLA